MPSDGEPVRRHWIPKNITASFSIVSKSVAEQFKEHNVLSRTEVDYEEARLKDLGEDSRGFLYYRDSDTFVFSKEDMDAIKNIILKMGGEKGKSKGVMRIEVPDGPDAPMFIYSDKIDVAFLVMSQPESNFDEEEDEEGEEE